MRPVCLHLKGFTSFKEETTVSFAHLDRFAVCGPTGAGKSSPLGDNLIPEHRLVRVESQRGGREQERVLAIVKRAERELEAG